MNFKFAHLARKIAFVHRISLAVAIDKGVLTESFVDFLSFDIEIVFVCLDFLYNVVLLINLLGVLVCMINPVLIILRISIILIIDLILYILLRKR